MGSADNPMTAAGAVWGLLLLAASHLLTLTQGERLRPEELYTELYNDDMLTCAKSLYDFDTRSCDLTTKEIRNVAIDYLCRYSIAKQVIRFGMRITEPVLRQCYCCGHYYSYLEYGEICTAFCDTDKDTQGTQRQRSPLIRLPFNWGDGCPDAKFDGDRNPVPLGNCVPYSGAGDYDISQNADLIRTTTKLPLRWTTTTNKPNRRPTASKKTTTTRTLTTTANTTTAKRTTTTRRTTTRTVTSTGYQATTRYRKPATTASPSSREKIQIEVKDVEPQKKRA